MNEAEARALLEYAEEQLAVVKSWGVTNVDLREASTGVVNFETDDNEELENLLRAVNHIAFLAYTGSEAERTILTVANAKVFKET